MRLVPCSRPTGLLDPAPLTALCSGPDTDSAAPGPVAYEAFWAEDDGYYLRRIEDGEASWLAGRADVDLAAAAGPSSATRRTGAHVAVPALPAAPAASGRLRVALVGRRHGRQHGQRRTRVAMHLCVRRVRPSP